MTLNERLQYHVSGAIERKEAEAIIGIPYMNCRAMFLEYWNNFITVERFAEHYHMTRETAMLTIMQGRAEHDAYCAKLQREAVT